MQIGGGSAVTRILVIDDEPNMVRFVTRALDRRGYTVDSALDGLRGLRLAESGVYDLLVIDLLLPGVDGVTVLREALKRRPEQRVVVMSAISDVETKIRCLELGALDYLVKPVELRELVARIRSRLRQVAPAKASRVVRAGGVELDLDRRVVLTDGGMATLSTREFRLLEHLMRHHRRVCARDDLLQSVWGYSFDPGTNVVDVYVGRLRAKVGNHAIETVRGVGYCFLGS
jgi:two-component system OmpR family response regulator